MNRACLVLLAMSAATLAQEKTDPTFRVDVQLVRMLATVKDVNGRPVGGLGKKDFKISDNGVRQEVALFERHTEQPLSVAILLDISGSTAKEMRYQTEAVQRFLKALFGEGNPEDRAALYAFNWQVRREVSYSRNMLRFLETLKLLKAEAGTALYDAIFLASEDIQERDGRHVLVVVTDGGDTFSSTTFHKAMEAVHAADAVLYPILTVPITNDAGRNVGGENALTLMAQTTGGRLFAPGVNGLDYAFADILSDLRTQYLIGYYPRGVPASKDRFHKIQVSLERPDLRVVTRTGYYGDFETPGGPGGSDANRPREVPSVRLPPRK
jgi:Ca-activated chloride channel family protein